MQRKNHTSKSRLLQHTTFIHFDKISMCQWKGRTPKKTLFRGMWLVRFLCAWFPHYTDLAVSRALLTKADLNIFKYFNWWEVHWWIVHYLRNPSSWWMMSMVFTWNSGGMFVHLILMFIEFEKCEAFSKDCNKISVRLIVLPMFLISLDLFVTEYKQMRSLFDSTF